MNDYDEMEEDGHDIQYFVTVHDTRKGEKSISDCSKVCECNLWNIGVELDKGQYVSVIQIPDQIH